MKPPPSKKYPEFHAACGRAAVTSGAMEHLDKMDIKYESSSVLASDGNFSSLKIRVPCI